MNYLSKIKTHLFPLCVFFAYIVMFIISPSSGITSLKNSGYYIKEMLMIMPVIFVLTALLDMWVPKEKITKLLGKEAKAKGVLLSFVLGSVSAGPIYAAFPMCVMLYKKGASIMNLIIILSSWAVIKIPMLLNEMKFLGPQFMVIRWILTVVAILIFSFICSKLIKEEDLPMNNEPSDGLSIHPQACMGCTLCTKIYPELFEMQHKKACLKTSSDAIDYEKLEKAITSCPVKAIDRGLS